MLPDSTTSWQPIDPRSIPAGRVSGMVSAGMMAAGALFATLLVLFTQLAWPAKLMLVALMWVGVLLSLTGALVLPAWRYRFTTWRLTDEGLEIRRGRYFRSRLAVARSRVQHTDVSQGPVQRVFGVSTLTLYTAGTEHAAITLPGLTPETAIGLRAALTGKATEVGDGDGV
jgi:hypothetical protein